MSHNEKKSIFLLLPPTPHPKKEKKCIPPKIAFIPSTTDCEFVHAGREGENYWLLSLSNHVQKRSFQISLQTHGRPLFSPSSQGPVDEKDVAAILRSPCMMLIRRRFASGDSSLTLLPVVGVSNFCIVFVLFGFRLRTKLAVRLVGLTTHQTELRVALSLNYEYPLQGVLEVDPLCLGGHLKL